VKLHHVGIVVRSMDIALADYRDVLGMTPEEGPVYDPEQDANLIILRSREGGPGIELIEPVSDRSPCARQARKGGGIAHTCYSVRDIEGEFARLRDAGALTVRNPISAVLFGGKRVAFLFLRSRQLIELVEV
jgi:methylmalonyl-CoA/ethylmalonyl-CoA epimerase